MADKPSEKSEKTSGKMSTLQSVLKIVGKVLRPFGLYKVNSEYMGDVDKELEEIKTGLEAMKNVAERSTEAIEALNSGEKAKAVEIVLKFCDVDVERKELKAIDSKLQGGEGIEKAYAAVDGAKVTLEIMEAMKKQVAEAFENIKPILTNTVELIEKLAEKVVGLESAAASWSLPEKLGTPEAVWDSLGTAKDVKEGAEKTKEQLESLKGSIVEAAVGQS